MKQKLILIVLLGCISWNASSQNVGLSFSYFIPRNGYFSTPISPFSLRGVGVNINRFVALETGASLYRMSGFNMTGLPFESKEPLVGPNFTVMVPGELVIQLVGKGIQLDLKGGGFVFYGFAHKLNYGNMDRAIKDYENWDIANADLTYKNSPGYGYLFGAEVTVNVTSQVGISLETNYLAGQSKFPLTGSYSGGVMSGTNETMAADFPDAKIDFTGLEFSIGVIFSGGGGGKGPKKRRR